MQTMFIYQCSNHYFRYLTEKVVPGNRVTVMGIYSIKKSGKLNKKVIITGFKIFETKEFDVSLFFEDGNIFRHP